MKDIGYGADYRYDHAEGGHATGQKFLPEALQGANWYKPTNRGFEKMIAERLAWWSKKKKNSR